MRPANTQDHPKSLRYAAHGLPKEVRIKIGGHKNRMDRRVKAYQMWDFMVTSSVKHAVCFRCTGKGSKESICEFKKRLKGEVQFRDLVRLQPFLRLWAQRMEWNRPSFAYAWSCGDFVRRHFCRSNVFASICCFWIPSVNGLVEGNLLTGNQDFSMKYGIFMDFPVIFPVKTNQLNLGQSSTIPQQADSGGVCSRVHQSTEFADTFR